MSLCRRVHGHPSLGNSRTGTRSADLDVRTTPGRYTNLGAHRVWFAVRGAVGRYDDSAGRLTNTTARSSNDT